MLKLSLRLTVVAAVAALTCACAHQAARPDQDTYVVTIKKAPLERVEEGPVLIVRYEMTGHRDYQWVVVPDEQSRLYAASLLKALKIIGDSETVSVRAADAYVAGLEGAPESVQKRTAQLKADLAGHAAVVYSYENRPQLK